MGRKRDQREDDSGEADMSKRMKKQQQQQQKQQQQRAIDESFNISEVNDEDDSEMHLDELERVERLLSEFVEQKIPLPQSWKESALTRVLAHEREEDEEADESEVVENMNETYKSHVADALIAAHGLLSDNPVVVGSEEEKSVLQSHGSSPTEFQFRQYQSLRYETNIIADILDDVEQGGDLLKKLLDALELYESFESGQGEDSKEEEGDNKEKAEIAAALRKMATAFVKASLLQTEFALENGYANGTQESAQLLTERVINVLQKDDKDSKVVKIRETRTAIKVIALDMCALAFGLQRKSGQAIDVKKAIEHVTTAIALDGSFPYSLEIRAQIYISEKQFDKALEDASKAVEFNKIDSRSLSLRGSLYADHLKQYDKALEDFAKGIALDRHSERFSTCQLKRVALYWNHLNNTERAVVDLIDVTDDSEETDDVDAAEAFLKQELKFEEDSKKPYKALFDAVLAHKRIDAEKAMQILNDASKDLQGDKVAMSLVHFLRGMVHSNLMNQHEEALKEFDKALEGDHLATETTLNMLNSKGVLLSDGVKKPKEALKVLDHAISLIEKEKIKGQIARDTYANKANIYLNDLKKPAEAVELFERSSAAMDHGDAYMNYIIGMVYDEELDNAKKALEYYNKAIELDGSKAEYYSARAELYREKLDDEELAEKDEAVAILLRQSEDDDGDEILFMGDDEIDLDDDDDDDDDEE